MIVVPPVTREALECALKGMTIQQRHLTLQRWRFAKCCTAVSGSDTAVISGSVAVHTSRKHQSSSLQAITCQG